MCVPSYSHSSLLVLEEAHAHATPRSCQELPEDRAVSLAVRAPINALVTKRWFCDCLIIRSRIQSRGEISVGRQVFMM